MNMDITTLIENFKRRGIEAKYYDTASEAIDAILRIIPQGSSVTWGGSMTIRDMGLTQALTKSGRYNIIDRDLLTSEQEKRDAYLKGFDVDYYITGVNGLSEDGVIVSIDGNGNRVAAITYGPKNVLFVTSIKKIEGKTPAEALCRARRIAAPVNAQRFNIKTPCKIDGLCHDCHSPQCICNYVHFLRNSPGGRHKVILIGEDYGY